MFCGLILYFCLMYFISLVHIEETVTSSLVAFAFMIVPYFIFMKHTLYFCFFQQTYKSSSSQNCSSFIISRCCHWIVSSTVLFTRKDGTVEAIRLGLLLIIESSSTMFTRISVPLDAQLVYPSPMDYPLINTLPRVRPPPPPPFPAIAIRVSGSIPYSSSSIHISTLQHCSFNSFSISCWGSCS